MSPVPEYPRAATGNSTRSLQVITGYSHWRVSVSLMAPRSSVTEVNDNIFWRRQS